MGTETAGAAPASAFVRLDLVEAWAPKAYALQALPAYTVFVRKALLGLRADGTVVYVETTTNGLRLWRRTNWAGPLRALGPPGPVPTGFVVAKGLRMHHVRESSFTATIDGKRLLLCFTGEELDPSHPQHHLLARNLIAMTPTVGTLADWTQNLATRVRDPHRGRRAAATASLWRSVLNGTTEPASLPTRATVS